MVGYFIIIAIIFGYILMFLLHAYEDASPIHFYFCKSIRKIKHSCEPHNNYFFKFINSNHMPLYIIDK